MLSTTPMLISIMSLLGSTVSFKWVSRRLVRPARYLHLKFSSDETFEVRVLKAQFILGMVDSLSEELTKAMMHSTPQGDPPYTTTLYDDLLSSISHRVTEDLLQLQSDPGPTIGINENISYSLVLIPTANIPHQYPLWSAPLVTTNGNESIIQSIPLAAQMVLPLKVVEDDASRSSNPTSNITNEKAATSINDMIVSVALRYCLPPVVAQWFPHKLPQLVMQWVHEHWF